MPRSSFAALPLVGLLLALSAPVSATAQGCTGAPGASAFQQYCEAVPRADGGAEGANEATEGGGGTESSAVSGVSKSTSSSLSEAGSDGAAIERLAGGTRKSTEKSSKSTKSADSTKSTSTSGGSADDGAVLSERVDSPADPSANPLKAATNAVASGPTAGQGVVWGLVGLSVLGVGAAVFVRRRDAAFDAPTDND